MRVKQECVGATQDHFVGASGGVTAVFLPSAVEAEHDEDGLQPGDIFEGRYRIEGLLGSGGMGRVLGATEQGIVQRAVAIKVLRRTTDNSKELGRRFVQEATTVSQLAHPNTMRLFDFGETSDGRLFLVSERLTGRSLQDVIDECSILTPYRALRIVIQVLKALAEAHELGIVHRDVKPDNVILCRHQGECDFVKVIDFGIATGGHAATGPRLTPRGHILGTPHYMAPEQVDGRPPTPATDLYSVGVVLYRLLTGRLPFERATVVKVMMAHLREPPSPPLGLVDTPLGDIVLECLRKDPATRPTTADALRARLEAILGEFGRGGNEDTPDALAVVVAPPSSAVPTPPDALAAGGGRRTTGVVVLGVVAFLTTALLMLATGARRSDADAATVPQREPADSRQAQTAPQSQLHRSTP